MPNLINYDAASGTYFFNYLQNGNTTNPNGETTLITGNQLSTFLTTAYGDRCTVVSGRPYILFNHPNEVFSPPATATNSRYSVPSSSNWTDPVAWGNISTTSTPIYTPMTATQTAQTSTYGIFDSSHLGVVYGWATNTQFCLFRFNFLEYSNLTTATLSRFVVGGWMENSLFPDPAAYPQYRFSGLFCYSLSSTNNLRLHLTNTASSTKELKWGSAYNYSIISGDGQTPSSDLWCTTTLLVDVNDGSRCVGTVSPNMLIADGSSVTKGNTYRITSPTYNPFSASTKNDYLCLGNIPGNSSKKMLIRVWTE